MQNTTNTDRDAFISAGEVHFSDGILYSTDQLRAWVMAGFQLVALRHLGARLNVSLDRAVKSIVDSVPGLSLEYRSVFDNAWITFHEATVIYSGMIESLCHLEDSGHDTVFVNRGEDFHSATLRATLEAGVKDFIQEPASKSASTNLPVLCAAQKRTFAVTGCLYFGNPSDGFPHCDALFSLGFVQAYLLDRPTYRRVRDQLRKIEQAGHDRVFLHAGGAGNVEEAICFLADYHTKLMVGR